MTVRITSGRPDTCAPKCVKGKCRNAPIITWTPTLNAGSSIDKSNAGFMRLYAGSPDFLTFLEDTQSGKIDPCKDFCFEARVRAPTGSGSSMFGLREPGGSASNVEVVWDGSAWYINWYDGGGATTTAIAGISAPNDFNIWKVCRVGNNIIVTVNGVSSTHAVDGNYPTVLLTPFISAGDGSADSKTDASMYCVTQ